MTKEELYEKVRLHGMWLRGEPEGQKAKLNGLDLHGIFLGGADLRYADMGGTDFSGAILRSADFYGANFSGANFRGAALDSTNMWGANLYGAILSGASLKMANLNQANLRLSDLYHADFRGANLHMAELSSAKNVDTVAWDASTAFYAPQCPESGAYTAYKKAHGLIVELEIPADAMRSSATSRECRASKAKVISITYRDGTPAGYQVASDFDPTFIYVVGATVEARKFDTDRWKVHTSGIHHYITRAEAVMSI